MPYPLLSPRLVIEPLAAADIAAFVAYRRDPDVARWQSWEPSYSERDAAALIESQPADDLPDRGRWIQLALHDPRTGDLHGDVAIHVCADQPDTFEIGVTLAVSSQGRGIGREAVERLLSYLFTERRAHRVVAACDARNEPVARLLRRVGMRQESRQIDADYCKGEWTTLDGYAMLAPEWASAEGQR